MSYQVKLDVFEGPFDLLVWLVEKSGMDVCTVNISEITDQYIAYVRSGRSIPPDAAAEFMVLAATLLQIKSRMLLPAGEDPGQSAEEDLREELAEKISTYRRYRGLAEYLREKEEDAEHIFVKPGRGSFTVYGTSGRNSGREHGSVYRIFPKFPGTKKENH